MSRSGATRERWPWEKGRGGSLEGGKGREEEVVSQEGEER